MLECKCSFGLGTSSKRPFIRSVDLRSHFRLFLCSTNTTPTYRVIAVVCGLLVTLLQLFNLFVVLVRRHPGYQKLCTWYYSIGGPKHESYIKKAGLFKVDKMLVSALKLHSESLKLDCKCNNAGKSKRARSKKLTNYGRALFEYTKLDGAVNKGRRHQLYLEENLEWHSFHGRR